MFKVDYKRTKVIRFGFKVEQDNRNDVVLTSKPAF